MMLSRTYILGSITTISASITEGTPLDACIWFGVSWGGRPSYCDAVSSTCNDMYWTDSTRTAAMFGPPGIITSQLSERRVTCDQAREAYESHVVSGASGYDAGVAPLPTQPNKRQRRGRSNSRSRSSSTAPSEAVSQSVVDRPPVDVTTTTSRSAPRRRRKALATTSTTTTTTTTTTTSHSSVTISAHIDNVDSLIREWLLPAVQSFPHISLGEPQLDAMRQFLRLVSYDSVVSFLLDDPTTTTTTTPSPSEDEDEANFLFSLGRRYISTPTELVYDERFKHYFYERLSTLSSFSDLVSFINTDILEYVSVASVQDRTGMRQASQWFHLIADLCSEAIEEGHRPPHEWNGDLERYFATLTISEFPRMYDGDYAGDYHEPLTPSVVDPSTPLAEIDEIVFRIGQFVDQLNQVDMLLRDMDDFQAPDEYQIQLDNLEWIFSRYILPTNPVEDFAEAQIPDSFGTLIFLFRNEICGRVHRIANLVQWAANSPASRPRNARIISRIASNCQSISEINERITTSQYLFSLRHYTANPFQFARGARFEVRYPRFDTPHQVVSHSVRLLSRPSAYLLGDFVVVEGGNPDAGEIGIRRQWLTRMVDDIMRVGAEPRWDLFEYTDERHGWMRPKPIALNATYDDREVYSERFRLVGRVLGIALKYNIVPGVRLAPSVIALLGWGSSRSIFANAETVDRFLRDEDPGFVHGLNAIRDLDESVRDVVLETLHFEGLRPDGASIPVTADNLEEYLRMKKEQRLIGDIALPVADIVRGISDVIGRAALDLFSQQELMNMITGPLEVTAEMVREGVFFRNGVCPAGFPPAQWLLEIITDMTEANRRQFLFFVTSLQTPPINAHEGPWLRVVFDQTAPVTRLPLSHTCFNEITLPAYESLAQMRDRILTAITHAGTIENN